MLYMLVDAFRQPTSIGIKRHNRSSSFQGLPQAGSTPSAYLLGPPKLAEPKFNALFGSEDRTPFQEPERTEEPVQTSYVTRLSSWLARRPSRSNRTDASGEHGNLWSQEQAERGNSLVSESIQAKVSHQSSPAQQGITLEVRDSGQEALEPKVTEPKPIITVSSEQIPTATPLLASPPRVYSRDMDKQYLYPSTPNSSLETSDSPIHGLYGIVNPKSPMLTDVFQTEEDPRQLFNSDSSARSSAISMLLRQQAELDRSIAQLQLFSQTGNDSRRTSSSGGTPKGSVRFSLSKFPAPPWGRESVVSEVPASEQIIAPMTQLSPEITQQRALMVDSPQPSTQPRQQSILSSGFSPRDSTLLSPMPASRNAKTASNGTQYEITSFIGRKFYPELALYLLLTCSP